MAFSLVCRSLDRIDTPAALFTRCLQLRYFYIDAESGLLDDCCLNPAIDSVKPTCFSGTEGSGRIIDTTDGSQFSDYRYQSWQIGAVVA